MPARRVVGLAMAAISLVVGFSMITVAQSGEATSADGDEVSQTRAVLSSIVTPETIAERFGSIVLVVLLSYLAYRLVVGSLKKAIEIAEKNAVALPGAARERQQRAVTIISLVSSVVRWAISLLALIWVLGALGINIVPVLTGVGFLGAAIAFGSQTLVKDVVSGFFVLLEGHYAVGDYVEVGGKFGMVESIGLRATLVRDLDNQLHYIPNGSITSSTVYEEHFVNYVLRVPLLEAADAQRAARIIERTAETAREHLPRHVLSVGRASVFASTDNISEIKLPFSVFPTQDWVATTEMPVRAKVMLAREGIAMPEGMAPACATDLANMPLVPLDEALVEHDSAEDDIISRWRAWMGSGDKKDPTHVGE